MSEELRFKRKVYFIPEQMVEDVEKFLKWIAKHACTDKQVQQLLLEYGMVDPEETEDILSAVSAERKRMIKEGTLKTLKTAHGDVDHIDHPLLDKGEKE